MTPDHLLAAIPQLETDLWRQGAGEQALLRYQRLFHDLEEVYAARRRLGHADDRHAFTLVIPVADRPRHLAECLASLMELCQTYRYGGQDADGRWRKLDVLIADDSRETEHITHHRALAADASQRGLRCHHLAPAEQRGLLESLPPELRRRLAGVLGDPDSAVFHHKGASVTRNIAYLWLRRRPADGQRRLFWFLDSDQEFRVNVSADDGEHQPYALNYLHWLDRLFDEQPIQVLTGKVVGDPPVSPAVMAGTLLEDVLAFLDRLARLDPEAACTLHGPTRPVRDAAYHDMADLFGFKDDTEAYAYPCPLAGPHDHADCCTHFARHLQRFFDGEHPTRRNTYQPEAVPASLAPARTLYTGNYVIRPDALDWFIPFADLRLRMAGPTLGRVLKAELGAGFVSANLPMLHKRTVAALGQSEFRPGLERHAQSVDLSGEFERQYFGDVMLFAMEQLAGCPHPDSAISATVEAVELEMRAKYRAKQSRVMALLARLEQRLADPRGWDSPRLADARAAFRRFAADLRANYAPQSPAWQRLEDPGHRAARLAAIARAITGYPAQRQAWREALGEPPRGSGFPG